MEFKNRLLVINAHDQAVAQAVNAPMAACQQCKKLYIPDQLAEENFMESMAMDSGLRSQGFCRRQIRI